MPALDAIFMLGNPSKAVYKLRSPAYNLVCAGLVPWGEVYLCQAITPRPPQAEAALQSQ